MRRTTTRCPLRPAAQLIAACSLLCSLEACSAPEPTPVPEPALPLQPAAAPVDFVKDIRPILAAHCHSCHGPTKQRGDLRLDSREHALKGGASGPVIKPGHSDESLLFRLVNGVEKDQVMPPKGDRLTGEQIALLRAWIDGGAVWPAQAAAPSDGPQKHWAYRKPVRPELPVVKDLSWPRNAIDFFVLARLEKEGLRPSAEADPAKLIRRVTLDLTGLPPTPAEVDTFLADSDPHAYDKVVDRLLASPHYGERWARPWLDLARYADTDGYHIDTARSMWPYRDWVIAAFNRNMPFDQFTIEQIAGDLLPMAGLEQRVATGFHRNTMFNQEGGIDPEEFRVKAVADRVNTTATVWLGTTLGCAECHAHKYDPFSQSDYYRLFAFFNNVPETGGGPGASRAPVLEFPGGDPKVRPTTLVMEELLHPRKTHVHIRGDFLNQGQQVSPGVPAVLHPLPEGQPADRLGLARWLVDRDNPLVGRVTMNRFWESVFGQGLVETGDDFGTQGTPPTHPELLDWLATEFPRRDWDLKAMLRLIVTSATYRQSARVPAELLERDPDNKLLARGPRFRMEAEMIRDNALAASGLRDTRIGGPSVYPPQPEGLWLVLGTAEFGMGKWPASEGPDRYRRGVYTFWRRSIAYPTFTLFDAPNREYCTVQRRRTNTPLQALTTLNDPAFVEAARALAARVMAESGPDVAQRLTRAFRLCLARSPRPGELERLAALYRQQLDNFTRHTGQAEALTGQGPAGPSGDRAERAALTVVANVLLNLDETITKD